jgi:hypothetical protein
MSDAPREALERIVLKPEVSRLLLAATRARIDSGENAAALLRRAGELARGIGALEEAADYYRRLASLVPGDSVAANMARLLAGEAPRAEPPSPFLRITGLLGSERLASVWAHLQARTADWEPTGVYSPEAGGRVDASMRDSRCLRSIEDLLPLVMPAIRAARAETDALVRLGLSGNLEASVEVDLVSHMNGGKFRAHIDSGGPPGGKMARRLLTFVYYLHRVPRRFAGGDLALFDGPLASGGIHAFTRLPPDNDSLVLFPAHHLHAVLPVEGISDDPLDGRLAFTGWFVREAARL